MENIPEGAEYYYKHTYYQLSNSMYARYFSRVWRDSAMVSNEELKRNGTRINVNETFTRTD